VFNRRSVALVSLVGRFGDTRSAMRMMIHCSTTPYRIHNLFTIAEMANLLERLPSECQFEPRFVLVHLASLQVPNIFSCSLGASANLSSSYASEDPGPRDIRSPSSLIHAQPFIAVQSNRPCEVLLVAHRDSTCLTRMANDTSCFQGGRRPCRLFLERWCRGCMI
jgi:hypothetical protein